MSYDLFFRSRNADAQLSRDADQTDSTMLPVSFNLNYFRAHPFGLEAESEVGAFVLAPNVIMENLAGMTWTTILPETKMSANKRHFFAGKQLQASGPFSHVRLNMFPDGGISRLRVLGTVAQ